MKATLDATLARRNECGAQLPEYPDDSTMHVFELFTDVLKEDKKVCKTSATHWRSKLVKTVVSTREKVEDGLVRTVSALEKAASKSCVRLLKVHDDAMHVHYCSRVSAPQVHRTHSVLFGAWVVVAGSRMYCSGLRSCSIAMVVWRDLRK